MNLLRRALCALLFVVVVLPAWAADRYWVGGAGNWNTTNTVNWATSSGGAGGASIPSSSDNVFFDGNSGTGTVTVTQFTNNIVNLTFTGYTGTFRMEDIVAATGNITLSSGMTFTANVVGQEFRCGGNITTNGITIPVNVVAFNNGTCSLQDDLTSLGQLSGFTATTSTLLTNNRNVTVFRIGPFPSGTTLTPGSSMITVTGSGVVAGAFGGTITANTATVKFTDSSSTNKSMQFGTNPFSVVWLSGNGTGRFVFTTTGTIGELKTDTPPKLLRFTAGITITLSTWTVSGTSGNLVTLDSATAGSAFTLSDSSGTNVCNFCDIKDSTASGGATWNATNSTNSGGNTGWNFISSAYPYSIIGVVIP